MIYLNDQSKTPLYEQIYKQLKEGIIHGHIDAGYRLPSTRSLAKELHVGRNTVENAYQQLYVEGYIDSVVGSGYYVLNIREKTLKMYDSLNRKNNKQSRIAAKSNTKTEEATTSPPIDFDFHFRNLNHDCFPEKYWRGHLLEALSYYNDNKIGSYNDKQGEYNLRTEIRKYLNEARGMVCSEEQIIMTSGLQFAMDIVCTLLPEKYRCIGIEDPCYDSIRRLFINHNFPTISYPVTPGADYITPLAHSKIRTAFVTPSYQFPTGNIMPIDARYDFLRWANEKDCLIIEDDYDSEFRYNARPVPALFSIDQGERVIYFDSYSKPISPSFRLSFLVLPYSLLDAYHARYAGYPPPISWLDQQTLYLFKHSGNYYRHTRKLFKIFKNKRETLLHSIKDHLGENVEVIGADAGMHILLRVKSSYNETELIAKARNNSVGIYPASIYWANEVNRPQDVVMIGFSSIPLERIDEGIKRLKESWYKE